MAAGGAVSRVDWHLPAEGGYLKSKSFEKKYYLNSILVHNLALTTLVFVFSWLYSNILDCQFYLFHDFIRLRVRLYYDICFL